MLIRHIRFGECVLHSKNLSYEVKFWNQIQRLHKAQRRNPPITSAFPWPISKALFRTLFFEAEEGCRKLARSSSSRETGQSSSALEVWYCYIVRHSVRLIGHLLLFCWGVWTPCTTPRPGLRVCRSAFSFDHVISTLILDVGALYIELVPVPCIQACIMYYCTYLQVKKVWSDVRQRSIGSWSLLPWASCSSLFADLRLSLLVPSPDQEVERWQIWLH